MKSFRDINRHTYTTGGVKKKKRNGTAGVKGSNQANFLALKIVLFIADTSCTLTGLLDSSKLHLTDILHAADLISCSFKPVSSFIQQVQSIKTSNKERNLFHLIYFEPLIHRYFYH